MLLKTITAPNMSDAMEQIRKLLGEDAIIVSSSTEADGGVKVTAALDRSLESANSNDQPAKEVSFSQMISATDIIGEAFDLHSVPRKLGDKIIEDVEALEIDDATLALASIFDARFSFEPIQPHDVRRPLILIGPPGVGKTLLTAKIATQAKFHDIPARALTLDILKAGGYEQLKAYMDALEYPLDKSESTESLDQKIIEASVDELKIIDTMGVNPFDRGELQELQAYVQTSGAEPVLVLSAGYDALEAGEIALKFKEFFSVRRFIFTRLDITKRYGSALVIAEKAKLAFSQASLSPLVAEGFMALNPLGLARLFVEGNKAG